MFSSIVRLVFPDKTPSETPTTPVKIPAFPIKLPSGAENIRSFSDALKLVYGDKIMTQNLTDFIHSNSN
ncbi:MAG: hypothetical protein LBC20_14040 [Planctomycetaceae bacterium]|jgi:hypothetical protein|nr:hypothetical protein [Planctomycetaceae bacterium]